MGRGDVASSRIALLGDQRCLPVSSPSTIRTLLTNCKPEEVKDNDGNLCCLASHDALTACTWCAMGLPFAGDRGVRDNLQHAVHPRGGERRVLRPRRRGTRGPQRREEPGGLRHSSGRGEGGLLPVSGARPPRAVASWVSVEMWRAFLVFGGNCALRSAVMRVSLAGVENESQRVPYLLRAYALGRVPF